MSAARDTCSAAASASARTAVDGWVPLISASPSFGARADRLQPGALSASAPAMKLNASSRTRRACFSAFSAISAAARRRRLNRLAFADQHQRQVRERREIAAGADRAARRHDGMDARFSSAISASSVSTLMPEKPFASTLARSAIVARTARTGSGSPSPAAWLRSRLSCSVSSASGEIFTSANDPKPVLMP